jgi:hypothetical protein
LHGADDYDGNVSRIFPGVKRIDNAEPIEIRHAAVQQDHLGVLFRGYREGLLTALGLDNTVPRLLQRSSNHQARRRFVISMKNDCLLVHIDAIDLPRRNDEASFPGWGKSVREHTLA